MKWSVGLQRIFIVVIVGFVCLALFAEAEQDRRPGLRERLEKARDAGKPSDSEDTTQRINWRELNLNRKQVERIKELRREFQIVTAGIRKELSFAENDLKAEIWRNNMDRETIEQLIVTISDLKQRLSEAATDNLLAFKELLSPEQLEKLAVSQQKLPKELRKLQLTDKQKLELRKLLKTSFRQYRKLSDELQGLKSELRDVLLEPDEPDEAALKTLQTHIAEKELALERAKVENQIAIRDLLHPEQRKLLEEE